MAFRLEFGQNLGSKLVVSRLKCFRRAVDAGLMRAESNDCDGFIAHRFLKAFRQFPGAPKRFQGCLAIVLWTTRPSSGLTAGFSSEAGGGMRCIIAFGDIPVGRAVKRPT